MLTITIPSRELWDEKTQEFVYTKEQTIQLEHSLVSISKWESKWHKPFLTKNEKTNEEIIDYVKCMTITQNVNPSVYKYLSIENIEQINQYIDNPMTATVFRNDKSEKANREIITSELIYYWMIALHIPPEYQKWHLNRLMTLIRVCNIKNTPKKKKSTKELLRERASINAARRKKH